VQLQIIFPCQTVSEGDHSMAHRHSSFVMGVLF
jgi:hypothetical protein